MSNFFENIFIFFIMIQYNYIWGSDDPFMGIRIQMSKSVNGFHPGPEIPLDHINALIGHLTDLRDQLKAQTVIPEKIEKNWNTIEQPEE